MEIARNGWVKDDADQDNKETEKLLPEKETAKADTNILTRCGHDPVHKRKVLRSLWIDLILIASGMVLGQNGPTLLDLQIITNTNLETASFFLTGNSIGYLAGSIICGSIYDRVNKPLFLLTSVVGLGLFSIITPFCFNFVAMIFIRVLAGIFYGATDAGGIAEQMRIWGNEGHELMHLLNFCFALGGVLSPLYSEPFLAQKNTQNFSLGNLTNSTNFPITPSESQPTTTNVQYAFIITGLFCIVTGIPWLVIYIQDKADTAKAGIKSDYVAKQRTVPLPILMYMTLMVSAMYFLYCCAEVSFSSFLMTFLVEEYNVTKSRGAQITAVFWGLFAASRFVMIFISHHVSSVKLLFISCFLMVITSVCFTVSALFAAVDALIVFTALFGFSVSAVFPSGISWAETELMRVTARVSACILVAASVGGMICPLLLGYLMESVSNMWFCYLMVIEIILMCLVFFVLFVTSRYFINKHYEFVNEATYGELNIPVAMAKI